MGSLNWKHWPTLRTTYCSPFCLGRTNLMKYWIATLYPVYSFIVGGSRWWCMRLQRKRCCSEKTATLMQMILLLSPESTHIYTITFFNVFRLAGMLVTFQLAWVMSLLFSTMDRASFDTLYVPKVFAGVASHTYELEWQPIIHIF